jgi:(p)ppGpp synthase/HD superfamily hydrolase
MKNMLEKVQAFAAQAHAGQIRKYANEPYVQHPIRVMQTCSGYSNDTALLAAALLHDVVEDTAVTETALHAFLSTITHAATAQRIVHITVELTDAFTKQAYPQLNRGQRKQKEHERLAHTSFEAQTIKYADIIDNSRDVVTQDPEFARTFLHEYHQLLQLITKGHAELYTLAVATVAQCRELLQQHLPTNQPGNR